MTPAIPPDVLEAVDLWERAQVLHVRAAWDGLPKAVDAAERLAAAPSAEVEQALIALLTHRSQLVVAHALFTLRKRKSPYLGTLPAELLLRRDKLTIVTGSFSMVTDLGGYARSLVPQASSKKTSSPP